MQTIITLEDSKSWKLLPNEKNDKKWIITAGKAKNEMANTDKHDATILPIQVRGTVSPYPIVVTVIYQYPIIK